MSCYSIGHGINNVVYHLLEFFDKGEVPIKVAKNLIMVCEKSVNFCDGNEGEAVECFEVQGRCSCCLEIKDDVENIYEELSEKMLPYKEMLEDLQYEDEMLGCTICHDCAKHLAEKYENTGKN